MDKGGTRDGTVFDSMLRREGLAVMGRKRNGEWIVDHQFRKLAGRLWPKVQGGPINIRLGAQETVNGGVGWGPALEFNPATQVTSDNEPISGRAIAVEFSSTNGWRVDGYKVDIKKLGQF
jgi:hypothetical protein